MRNRMREFRTFGSVRGEVREVRVCLHGHAAGNGGHGQDHTYGRAWPLLLGGASSCANTAASLSLRALPSLDGRGLAFALR